MCCDSHVSSFLVIRSPHVTSDCHLRLDCSHILNGFLPLRFILFKYVLPKVNEIYAHKIRKQVVICISTLHTKACTKSHYIYLNVFLVPILNKGWSACTNLLKPAWSTMLKGYSCSTIIAASSFLAMS